MAPTELLARLGRIAQEMPHLGWTEITRINFNQHTVGAALDADLLETTSAPFNRAPDTSKSLLHELLHGVAFPSGQHIIIGFRLLQHHPHAFDKISGVAPVTHRIEIT